MKQEKLNSLYKELRFILLITLTLILFRNIVEHLTNSVLVKPILSNLEISFINDLIIIGISIIIITNIINKLITNYHVSDKLVFISIIVNSFYFYYRFEQFPWTFKPFSFSDNFYYLDLIPLFFIGNLIIRLSYRYKKPNSENNAGFYFDEPLGDRGKDLLNRESLARYIAKEAENTISLKSSFAIGISSEWGFGKTSFLDLLKRYLDKKSNIVININPWISHEPRNIIKDFFNAFRLALGKYNSDISKLLKNYAEILVGLSDKKTYNILNPLINIYKQEETISSEFHAINSTIKTINKKIIVFIDDLDRLYKDEIIEVIKLIRNSANFGNTVFIVAYDRNYIINAIKDINSYKPEIFLEKIFQLEIKLPNFEKELIQKRIFELVSSRIEENDRSELEDILLKNKSWYDSNVFNSEVLTTLRDATRFSNSFLIAYSYLKGEVVLADLLNLEVLRLKYPEVYKLIFFNKDEFLETINNAYQKTYYTLKTEKLENENGKDQEVIIKKHLEKNYEKIGIPKSDINKALRLLYSLFPEAENIFYSQEDVGILSIANPSSFERYSHYRLLDSNLSEIEFSKYRSSDLDDFCAKIDEWITMGLRWELKKRFENIEEYSDKKDFEKIIQAIFHFARIPKKDSIGSDFSGYDYYDLYGKISNYEKYISLNYYKSEEDFREFILDIFKKAPSPYVFESEFIYNTFDRHSITYNFIIPKEEFQKIRIDYFKSYLSEASRLDNNIWLLYHLNDLIEAIPQNGNSYQIQKEQNPEATKLFIDFIKEKALDEYLFNIIAVQPFNEQLYGVGSIVPTMFGSFEKFKKFLEQFDDKDYNYLGEFKQFYNKLANNNYNSYIEFSFNIIPVSEKQHTTIR